MDHRPIRQWAGGLSLRVLTCRHDLPGFCLPRGEGYQVLGGNFEAALNGTVQGATRDALRVTEDQMEYF